MRGRKVGEWKGVVRECDNGTRVVVVREGRRWRRSGEEGRKGRGR